MKPEKKIIHIDGQPIEVTDEVYEVYTKGERKMRYFEEDLKTDRIKIDENGRVQKIKSKREESLEGLSESGMIQFYDESENTEEKVVRGEEYKKLNAAYESLTEREKQIISALFYENKSEQEVGKRLGVSKQYINKEKVRILKKMKKFF